MHPVTRLGSLTLTYNNVQFPSLPLFAAFPGGQNLLFKTTAIAQGKATANLQSLILRMLTTQAPGAVRFTFIDPADFGQSIAPFMQLAQYDEALVTSRVWTEASHIERQLADLSEYIALVNQRYLWGTYSSIEEYNEKNRSSVLPYHILVVQSFPYKFTPETARSLVNIARNGPRCGVCVVVMQDMEHAPLPGFNMGGLEQVSTVITWQGSRVVWDGVNIEAQAQAAMVL